MSRIFKYTNHIAFFVWLHEVSHLAVALILLGPKRIIWDETDLLKVEGEKWQWTYSGKVTYRAKFSGIKRKAIGMAPLYVIPLLTVVLWYITWPWGLWFTIAAGMSFPHWQLSDSDLGGWFHELDNVLTGLKL